MIDQTEAVGHAVRATYMYSGMADVAAMTGDDISYVKAIDKIWENVVGKKLYMTGGIGATGSGEAFGRNYELPNMTAYNETCAAIGNDYWNHRLFLLHGDAKYIDVMERTLYNGLISGVSLDGKTFFYPNPLESNGQHQRSPWFGVACCPGNITRFLASVPGLRLRAQRRHVLCEPVRRGHAPRSRLDGGRTVKMVQDDAVSVGRHGQDDSHSRAGAKFRRSMCVFPDGRAMSRCRAICIALAIAADEPVTLKVNGERRAASSPKGLCQPRSPMEAGDVVELNLPMPVRRVVANEQVAADRGRVALQRGPIVYAAEWPDNPDGRVRNLLLTDTSTLKSEYRPELLNGVAIVMGKAVALAYAAQGNVTKKEQEFTAIPYYAWANRGPGQMAVWIANSEAVAKPAPWPTIATTSKVTTSGRKNPRAINDGEEPRSSIDNESYFDWWPRKGTIEWVEYAFAKPATVSEGEVYWFDDTGRGQVRVPASWRWRRTTTATSGNPSRPPRHPRGRRARRAHMASTRIASTSSPSNRSKRTAFGWR